MNGEKCENVWAFDDLNFPANFKIGVIHICNS